MKKGHPLVVTLLLLILICSNAWWGYKLLDSGVTATYQAASLQETRQALFQSLAIIRELSRPDHTRASIIEAAHKAWSAMEPFEKEGYIWVGRLGLGFDGDGRLIRIKTDN